MFSIFFFPLVEPFSGHTIILAIDPPAVSVPIVCLLYNICNFITNIFCFSCWLSILNVLFFFMCEVIVYLRHQMPLSVLHFSCIRTLPCPAFSCKCWPIFHPFCWEIRKVSLYFSSPPWLSLKAGVFGCPPCPAVLPSCWPAALQCQHLPSIFALNYRPSTR